MNIFKSSNPGDHQERANISVQQQIFWNKLAQTTPCAALSKISSEDKSEPSLFLNGIQPNLILSLPHKSYTDAPEQIYHTNSAFTLKKPVTTWNNLDDIGNSKVCQEGTRWSPKYNGISAFTHSNTLPPKKMQIQKLPWLESANTCRSRMMDTNTRKDLPERNSQEATDDYNMVKLDSKSAESQEISEPSQLNKKETSKSNKYRVRHDVVEKSILRAIKNHYVSEFRTFFDFTKKSIRRKPNYSDLVYANALKYVNSKMPDNRFENLHVFLVALVDTKKNYVKPHPSYPNIKKQLSEMLKRYNSWKADQVIEQPEFAYLILRFFSVHDLSSKCQLYSSKVAAYKQRCLHRVDQCAFTTE